MARLMEYYFAPMEGITGYLYRNAHHELFGGARKYFSPFLVPGQSKSFTSRALNDVLPEHNQGLYLVPQLLTNRAQDFLWAAGELRQMGYGEINLNLGCPSGTVVSKHRGAGFLADTGELELFLDQIFSKAEVKISVKTRVGKDSYEEWPGLIEIFRKFPMEELIIHPRIQKDFYKNAPSLSAFEAGLEAFLFPVCYNGGLTSREEIRHFQEKYPQVHRLMLGRGLIANPGLIGQVETGEGIDLARLKAFHDQICQGYQSVMSGQRNVLFKMKELWFYMGELFPEGGRILKKIKKSQHLREYSQAVEELFSNSPLADRT